MSFITSPCALQAHHGRLLFNLLRENPPVPLVHPQAEAAGRPANKAAPSAGDVLAGRRAATHPPSSGETEDTDADYSGRLSIVERKAGNVCLSFSQGRKDCIHRQVE